MRCRRVNSGAGDTCGVWGVGADRGEAAWGKGRGNGAGFGEVIGQLPDHVGQSSAIAFYRLPHKSRADRLMARS